MSAFKSNSQESEFFVVFPVKGGAVMHFDWRTFVRFFV